MTPVLWSFRRCPYAIRARLGIASAGITVELREVVLRDKPQAFLLTSPSNTVPCLDTGDIVIDESFDIMLWALRHNDPEDWLVMPDEGFDLVRQNDSSFKQALDRYKYAIRHVDVDVDAEKQKAGLFLANLDDRLAGQSFLFGDTAKLADMAILPFVRQFSHVDLDWFNEQSWENVQRWLEAFKSSDRFQRVMAKYTQWSETADPVIFP